MKRVYRIVWILFLLIALTLFVTHPVVTKTQNLGIAITLFAITVSLLWFCRKIKLITIPILSAVVLLIIWLFIPSSPIDYKEIEHSYQNALEKYKSVTYHWGGENKFGIDCSGLPRKSLRDAFLSYTINHGNSDAFKQFLKLRWFDSSAKALSKGYRNYVTPLNISGTIKEIPYDHLKPGDLAITQDGLHVIIYYGNDQWIQADPWKKIVHIQNGRTGKSSRFNNQVSIYRWTKFITTKAIKG